MDNTKSTFLKEYRKLLVAEYAWAQDTSKLDHFMKSVENTLNSTTGAQFDWNAPLVKATWKAMGYRQKLTLKALRALPD